MRDVVKVRPWLEEDREGLDEFRRVYLAADLELPKGYMAAGVETAVADDDEGLLASLTGTLSVTFDPFTKRPGANPLHLALALRRLEMVLVAQARRAGAVDAYIAVPRGDKDYIEFLRKRGYEVTVENCVVMRKPLEPDTEPLLGTERDTAIAKAL